MMTGMVLGSGLGPLADAIQVERIVGFADAGLPASRVPGHAGCFVIGMLAEEPVVAMKGRVHLYEGHSPQEVTAGVRWMAAQGVTHLVLTNAAGTLNPEFAPGSWMMLADHLNLTGTSRCRVRSSSIFHPPTMPIGGTSFATPPGRLAWHCTRGCTRGCADRSTKRRRR